MLYTALIFSTLLQSFASAYPAVPTLPTPASVATAPTTPATSAMKQPVQIANNCLAPGTVALTFDDGIGGYERDLLRNLGNHKATFFVNGMNSP